jgi:hypothetical protein
MNAKDESPSIITVLVHVAEAIIFEVADEHITYQ